MATKINIAIDGYSSCGKGTLAKFLSSSLGYRFIDSGSMYRAVTLFIIRRGINPAETEKVVNELNQIHISFKWDEEISRYAIFLNSNNVEKDIRTMEVASSVSQIAKISEVRSYLVARQRAMAWEKGVVMDGRDIGTVVLPDAELKIFMTARPEIRARRRLKELVDSGIDTTYDAVLANITQRDEIDSTREDSPLTLTDDYRILDNSELTVTEQNSIAMKWVGETMMKIQN